MSELNGLAKRKLSIDLPYYLYEKVEEDSHTTMGGRRHSVGAVIRRILDQHYYGKNIDIAMSNRDQESGA